MRYLLPLLLVGATACYAPRAVGPGPDAYAGVSPYGGGYYDEPLQASVWFDEYSGYAWFDVNRPAHVAIFAIRPGISASMIYPAVGYGGRQLFTSGRHSVHTWASPYRFASNLSLVYGPSPTYIVMVASEAPLDVTRFMATGYTPALQQRVLAYGINPYAIGDQLAWEVVPHPQTTDYTVAYHVVWPTNWYSTPDQRGARAYVWVTCANGTILSVPMEAYYAGWVVCPDQQQGVEAPDSARSVPEIKKQLPKRPVVPNGWVASGDKDRPNPLVPGAGDGAGKDGEALPRLRPRTGKPVVAGRDGPARPQTGERVSTERPVIVPVRPQRPETVADDGAGDDAAGSATARGRGSPPTTFPTMTPADKPSTETREAPPRVDRPAEPAARPRPVTPSVERRAPPKVERPSTPRSTPVRSAPASRPSSSSKPSKPSKPGGGGGG